ncbi:MAG: InlB B-repeat-containing protein, partial [Clostridia bacterium]|nr:InlB B-repeat-containing protein [Clostridia bacterium]
MERAEIVSANGFAFDGNNGKISVSNDTETYSFINQIQVNAKATWVISTDIYGLQTVATKTIPLNIGDNTVYLLVTSGDGNNINLYTMTVRRRPIYTVSFNTDGGTSIASQQVEEDSCATIPTDTTKKGYTFTGWNYDFNEQITDNTVITAQWIYYTLTASVNNNKAGTVTRFSDTKITVDDSVTVTATTNAGYTFDGWYNGDCLLTSELNYTFNMPRENLIYTAKWTANTDTPYKIEYYLENLDDDNYTLQENDTENLTGITVATITATKTFEHFTVVYGTDTGNINGNGNTVLKVYYRRDKYTVQILSSNDGVTLSQTFNGKYKYGYTIPEITVNYNTIYNNYLGYEWRGWY